MFFFAKHFINGAVELWPVASFMGDPKGPRVFGHVKRDIPGPAIKE